MLQNMRSGVRVFLMVQPLLELLDFSAKFFF
jgi:hypothetical protein